MDFPSALYGKGAIAVEFKLIDDIRPSGSFSVRRRSIGSMNAALIFPSGTSISIASTEPTSQICLRNTS